MALPSLEDLALVQLEDGVDFVGSRDPLETDDPAWEQRVRFKSTVEFVQLMDDFIARLPQLAFQAKNYEYKDWTVPAEWIQGRVDVYKRSPLMKRLEMVADDIHSRLENEFLREEEPPHRNRIFQALRKMLTMKTTLSAYRAFFRQLGKERAKLYKPFQKGVLEWNDVYPYLYLQAAFTGLQESRLIKHLVIDEMQDYSPIQYAVLNLLFQCPKTILGDFSQSINPYSPYTLEDLHQLYEGSQLMRLEKSYRSTWEIIHFAKGIVEQTDFQAVERHGPAPELLEFSTEEEELVEICRRVEAFHQGKYNAFGIVTRTNSQARELHEKLKALGADVALITPESSSFHNGATVLSIQMSKGLEFDQVLIPQADGENYHTDFDKNLLYVACTRAMHQLDISCVGEVSPCCPLGRRSKQKGRTFWPSPFLCSVVAAGVSPAAVLPAGVAFAVALPVVVHSTSGKKTSLPASKSATAWSALPVTPPYSWMPAWARAVLAPPPMPPQMRVSTALGLQKARQGPVAGAVGIHHLRGGHPALLGLINFELGRVAEVLEHLAVFIGYCDFHKKSLLKSIGFILTETLSLLYNDEKRTRKGPCKSTGHNP